MRYRLTDLELTAPLPALRLDADEDGIGLVLRRHGRPVHFSLHALPPGSALDGDALWALAAADAGQEVLAQAIRDELRPRPEARPVSVTIAVCTHARPELLEPCLRSILALRDAGAASAPEVLVVDNAPPDDATRRLVDGLPGVRYAVEPVPGLDVARNRALAEAGTDYVAFLDDDVVAEPSWLAGLEEALAENPDAGAITGLVLPYELETAAQLLFERGGGFRRGFAKLRYEGAHQPGNPLYPTGAGIFGAGCDMVLDRRLVLELGGFDEALDTGRPLPGGGDLDIFQRVLRAGRPLVYEPLMTVRHRHRREHGALVRQYRTWGDGFMAYVAKTYAADPRQRAKLNALLAWWARDSVAEVARTARGASHGSPQLALAQLAGGLVGLTGSYRRSRRRMAALREAHG